MLNIIQQSIDVHQHTTDYSLQFYYTMKEQRILMYRKSRSRYHIVGAMIRVILIGRTLKLEFIAVILQ